MEAMGATTHRFINIITSVITTTTTISPTITHPSLVVAFWGQHKEKNMLGLLLWTAAALVWTVASQQPLDTAVCTRVRICNGDYCYDVCQQGTVVVDDWAVQSLKFQRQLQRNMTLW